MCEPTLIATAVGAAITAYGQKKAGDAQSDLAKYQSQIADNNAIYAEAMALDAEDRGRIAASNKKEETEQFKAKQLVAAAANGSDVNVGSIVDLTSTTAKYGELDRLTILSNARREAFQNRVNAQNIKTGGDITLAEGKIAKDSSKFEALGTALTGTGDVAAKWYDLNKAGVNVLPNFGGSKTKPKNTPLFLR